MTRKPGDEVGKRIAIVGSRTGVPSGLVWAFVRDLPQDTVIVSGGAEGVDSAAQLAAERRGLKCEVYTPDWKGFGRRAGFVRNRKIVENCDSLVAFWDGKSKGTMHSIKLAREMGRPVIVFEQES